MATTLLRRYMIKPGHWDAFLMVWSEIVRVRLRFGFTVHFAYVDRANHVFTWAISHPGDIDLVAARYYADPQRQALNHVTDHLERWEITPVEQLALTCRTEPLPDEAHPGNVSSGRRRRAVRLR